MVFLYSCRVRNLAKTEEPMALINIPLPHISHFSEVKYISFAGKGRNASVIGISANTLPIEFVLKDVIILRH